ncbi:MAG: AMP-binding protein [Candidatus Riflemargulisbacteria bacterium]
MTNINLENIISTNSEGIAVIDSKGNSSYLELQLRVNQIASELIRKGVRVGDIVGVLLPRGRDMVASVLAVWKVGATVVPLDINYPKARILNMLKQSVPQVVICSNEDLYDFFADFTRNDGELIKTKLRSNLDFASLSIPNRTYVDYSKYKTWTKMAIAKDVMTMQFTRGCPYSCLYCHKIWSKKHSTRTAEQMLEEVNLFYKAGVRKFSIVDDIFNWDINNSKRFFELIIKNKLEIQLFFGNGIRGDILSKDYIDLMVEAGLIHLSLALESASPRIQKLLRKNINIEKLHSNMEYIIQNHQHVVLDLFTMLGFPTETESEALLTLDFIKSLKWLNNPYIFLLKIYLNGKLLYITTSP